MRIITTFPWFDTYKGSKIAGSKTASGTRSCVLAIQKTEDLGEDGLVVFFARGVAFVGKADQPGPPFRLKKLRDKPFGVGKRDDIVADRMHGAQVRRFGCIIAERRKPASQLQPSRALREPLPGKIPHMRAFEKIRDVRDAPEAHDPARAGLRPCDRPGWREGREQGKMSSS